jgi:hypothetical protein
MPTPPFPANGLATGPIATLLAHFARALPWLSDAHGLVQTGVDNTGKHKYPQRYEPGGNGRDVLALYPDQTMGALCFFERDGPSKLEWADQQGISGDWLHPLAVVVWCNLSTLDPKRSDDFTDELLNDFLGRGLLGIPPLDSFLTPGGVEQQAERVFARYNFPAERQQLLVYPFSGFRIPFTLRQRYASNCAAPFTPTP